MESACDKRIQWGLSYQIIFVVSVSAPLSEYGHDQLSRQNQFCIFIDLLPEEGELLAKHKSFPANNIITSAIELYSICVFERV